MSFLLVDRTAFAPARVRLRTRAPGEVRVLALHQMACGADWREDSPAWDRVAAHLVVKRSGAVQLNHDPLERLLVGSGPVWNPSCVTVEFAGNLPTSIGRDGAPRWWRPETHGRDLLTPEQVQAGRALVAWLRERLPALTEAGAHRQVSRGKAGCCGPNAWREVGAWAVASGGLRLAATAPSGLDIPAAWWPPGALGGTEPGPGAGEGQGTGRAYGGPLEASGFARGGVAPSPGATPLAA